MTIRTLLSALPLCALATLAQGQDRQGFRANVMDRDGNSVGSVDLEPTDSGVMLLSMSFTGLPEGVHAVHLHETGICEGDFSSAGGHIAGDAAHGIFSADGPHPGDLPNLVVSAGGQAAVQYFNERLSTDMIADDDGAALVVHSEPDDYESQPAGDAGERIACGVFEPLQPAE